MEQTLGKRIAENRKRLKLTQDQLAEKLGLTAQAVSKWENDLSCPDITMLPKLAEIFGITTDALLGMESPKEVFEAEVVTEEKAGINFDLNTDNNGNWEFHWDSGKRGYLAFAVMVLLIGGLLLAARILQWDVSFWSIAWPSALLVFGIKELLEKVSVSAIGLSILGGYFLVANLGIWELEIGKELIFPILVVLFGFHLLIEALKKPKKQQYWVKKDGATVYRDGHQGRPQVTCTTEDEEFECISSFGDYHQSVDLPRLSGGEVICSFGDLTLDLSGCETLGEDCEIEATCSFGLLTLMVPRRFRVVPNTNSSFADFAIEGHPDPDTQQIIQLDANVSFGSIRIHYI